MTNIKIHLISIIIALFALTACHSEGDNPVITVIHTNDTHSQIDPIYSDEHPHGGVVERAAFIEKMRHDDPALLYIDAGDMVQGSPYFNIYNGEVEIKAMNKQGLLASTFGNHEFDNGLNFLGDMLHIAAFPILSCNYDCTGTVLEKYVQRKMVIERHGVKIGLTGVTVNPENLIFNKNWEGIKYTDPSSSANKVAAELRAEGCDIVILISHVGYFPTDSIGDRQIARNSKDIDIIIGGHTHTDIENGFKMDNADGKPIWITQTGAKASPIGRVKIEMKKSSNRNRKYEVEDMKIDKLHPGMDDMSEYGLSMMDFITPFKDSLDLKMNIVLGDAPETMVRTRPQSLLGNFAADALLELGEKYYGHKMDVGIMNVGGLRSDLDRGNVTLGTMYRIFPFENTLTILELKGKYLEKLFKSIAGKGLEALSGVNITLSTIKDRTEAVDIKVGGEPIDPERTYYISTIDYLAEGNDGLTALTNAHKITNTGMLLRDVMTKYVQDLTASGKKVASKLDNRVIVK